MNDNLIYVAKLGKAVGLKGYLKLLIDSDFLNSSNKIILPFILKTRLQ